MMFGQQMLDDAYGLDQMRSDADRNEDQPGVPRDKIKPQVWKLNENSLMDPSPLPQLSTFTLQETLFVEQLTATDEGVRYQVLHDDAFDWFIRIQLSLQLSLNNTFLFRFQWKCPMVAHF